MCKDYIATYFIRCAKITLPLFYKIGRGCIAKYLIRCIKNIFRLVAYIYCIYYQYILILFMLFFRRFAFILQYYFFGRYNIVCNLVN